MSEFALLERIAALEKAVDLLNTRLAERLNDEFIKCKNLLNSPEWPAAVNPDLIVDINSEQDKLDRAEGILDILVDMSIEGLKVLDFGCGEGHLVNRTKLHKVKFSMGYDIVESIRWKEWTDGATQFSTHWGDVTKNAPYDVVIVYDVLDHITEPDGPVKALKNIKEVLAPGGRVYVRCHPWCSRHGTHLYQKINKAYIHLVFDKEELKAMGHEEQEVVPVIHPIWHYGNWFKEAGFSEIKPKITKQNVEPFFIDSPLVANRIKSRWKGSPNADLSSGSSYPNFQMEQQFLDYILL